MQENSEDTLELIPSQRKGEGGVASDSGDSDVAYETSKM